MSLVDTTSETNNINHNNDKKYNTHKSSKKRDLGDSTDEVKCTNNNNNNCNNNKKTNRWKLSDFEIGRQIGLGRFCSVYVARHIDSQQIVAMKVISRDDVEKNHFIYQLRREVEIQAHLSHRSILQLYGYFYDNERVYLVLEFAPGGDLYKQLQMNGTFSDQQAAFYVKDVALALDYIHSLCVIHRDLKPENLLLDASGRIKLSDFGWAVIDHKNEKRKTICGTLDYLSPEMIENVPHTQSVDLWGLGILIYEFLIGQPPFEDNGLAETYHKITMTPLVFKKPIDPDARSLIENLLQKDPSKRMTAKEVLSHRWIIKNTSQ